MARSAFNGWTRRHFDKKGGVVMTEQSKSQVFSGNAAIPYAAFNLRDPYYREMARFVIRAAEVQFDKPFEAVVDLGAGIGISTMEILARVGADCRVIAVEPEEGM